MSIQLEWREVEGDNRGFQLSPPYGREYDLWCRQSKSKELHNGAWSEWEVVIMPPTPTKGVDR